jgi:hypothetical protein
VGFDHFDRTRRVRVSRRISQRAYEGAKRVVAR